MIKHMVHIMICFHQEKMLVISCRVSVVRVTLDMLTAEFSKECADGCKERTVTREGRQLNKILQGMMEAIN